MPSSDAKAVGPFESGDRVSVYPPLPIAGPYDYSVPDGLVLSAGDFVRVPLGRREISGVVWGAGTGEVEDAKLKPVSARHDVRPLTEAMRAFVEWVANYTLYRPGAVLRMAMSVPDALEPPKPRPAYVRSEAPPDDAKITPARAKVLAALDGVPPFGATEIARLAGVGTGVVTGMAKIGLLDAVEIVPRLAIDAPDPAAAGVDLSTAQQTLAADLTAQVRAAAYGVTVLDGVTGSGKTEVYFEAVAAALTAGRQVLVLLPEIALSAQWLDRFQARFGARPAEWHSDLTGLTRRLTWRAVASGEARVVVGARSALFLPFPELGLIVVDEEHDASYKQDDGVAYHARDMAVVRGKLEDIPVVLASATPSLETMTNVRDGRYRYLELPDRHGGAALPDIQLVDLRADPPPRQQWLSPPLRAAIAETLEAGEQALLFLNRRGYAPLTLCRTCGFRLHCPQCSAWLVEHRLSGRLECHHCGYGARPPAACPDCQAADSFAACGPGVERIAEEAGQLWPEARLAVMASDTVHGPAQAADFLRRVTDHEIDLLIGTQIIAKGHHFPMLTLVGVVDADLGLAGGDLRAAERTYQLLHQVAGRAGRAERPGRVLLQTYLPEHPVMRALVSGDRAAFLEAEAKDRATGPWPPYGRLAALVVSGRHSDRVERAARDLGRAAPHGAGIEALGPAPAPLSLLRGRHRRRLLLKTGRDKNIQAILRRWLSQVEIPPGVRVQVDVNPYGFL